MANDSNIPQDDIQLVAQFEDKTRKPQKNFIVDFWGTKINAKYYTHLHENVLNLPYPSDGILHDFIEYLGTAVAVNLAKDRKSFTSIELGAGIGPWLVRSAKLATKIGIKKVKLIGVEADRQHCNWMKKHLQENGFKSGLFSKYKVKLYNMPISGNEEYLYFPRLDSPQYDWGASASIKKSASDYRGLELEQIRVKALPINKLLSDYDRIELLHVDIQGLEFEVLSKGIKLLNTITKVLVIGTHSRKIEGDLLDLFYKNKWNLRAEKPCQFLYNKNANSLTGMTSKDGTQVWINDLI